MSVNRYLIDYYSTYDEESRLTSRHGSVEFLTTMRYIEKYIKPGDRILEIGAATGRYSHTLARKGYTVDAIELVEHNIELFKQNTQSGENATITQGNAMDLSGIGDNTYDITLILGPLYHLYNMEDKRQAVREALRVTKKGGVLFAAHVISDLFILDEIFRRKYLNLTDYIEKGLIDSETFAITSEPKELFELVRKEHIDELMSVFPVTRLHYAATDGCTNSMREIIDEMSDDEFSLYLKYHFAICERSDMVGVTNHIIDVFKK